MNNTIILLEGKANLTQREYKKFAKGDTIWGNDCYPKELERWNIEQINDAKAKLANYKCDYYNAGESVYITEYALEYCECDEDGEFIQGADFDLAEEKIGGKDLMNNFTIYRNYGVLRAEKRNVYTYGAPHINGVCSDELKVKLPDDCDWKLFENNFGQTMIETPWGWAYNLNEVLQGNESPCLYALDKDQKAHRVELVIIEEK